MHLSKLPTKTWLSACSYCQKGRREVKTKHYVSALCAGYLGFLTNSLFNLAIQHLLSSDWPSGLFIVPQLFSLEFCSILLTIKRELVANLDLKCFCNLL